MGIPGIREYSKAEVLSSFWAGPKCTHGVGQGPKGAQELALFSQQIRSSPFFFLKTDCIMFPHKISSDLVFAGVLKFESEFLNCEINEVYLILDHKLKSFSHCRCLSQTTGVLNRGLGFCVSVNPAAALWDELKRHFRTSLYFKSSFSFTPLSWAKKRTRTLSFNEHILLFLYINIFMHCRTFGSFVWIRQTINFTSTGTRLPVCPV